jgi:hypothetical protein
VVWSVVVGAGRGPGHVCLAAGWARQALRRTGSGRGGSMMGGSSEKGAWKLSLRHGWHGSEPSSEAGTAPGSLKSATTADTPRQGCS